MPTPRSSVSTPQPFRDDIMRDRTSYETELWDDYANAIFGDSLTPGITYHQGETHLGAAGSTDQIYLEIPCPVPARLEVTACGQVTSAAGRSDISYGSQLFTTSLGTPPQLPARVQQTFGVIAMFPICFNTFYDVPAGLAVVGGFVVIGNPSVNVEWESTTITVRRGRIP